MEPAASWPTRFPRADSAVHAFPMPKAKTLGLVGSGKISDSPVSRLLIPGERLGPVKAPSLRVASRIANSLRAGYPVADYQHFEQCGLILISVPDGWVGSIVAEMASYPLTWTRKTVVLCSATLGSEALAPMAAHGAQVGSLSVIPGFEEHWLILEGAKPIELQIKRFIDLGSRRLTVIRPPRKPFYLAGLACAGSMLAPMLIAAGDALQNAGISRVQASAIIERQVGLSVRAYLKAGRKAHRRSGNIAEVSERVEAMDATLARYLNESVQTAKMMVKGR